MDAKIYTERKMLVGVAIGGPLAGGYYFWRTLNAFRRPKGAIAGAAAAVVVLAMITGSNFVPWLDRLPNIVFYGLQFGLVMGVTRSYLLTEITEHLAEGKGVYGWGNTILVAVTSMVITLGLLLAFLFSFDRTTTRSFGPLNHEIVFDSSELTEIEVDRLAAALTGAGFFDKELRKTVEAARSNDRIIITMYCSESARDPEFIELAKTLRSDVQQSFLTNPIVLDLVIDTPGNRIARLE
jgi:hypothetical protein